LYVEALYLLDILYRPGHNAVDIPVISKMGAFVMERAAEVWRAIVIHLAFV